MARKNEGQMKMDMGTGVRIPRQARNDGTGERISRCARNDGGGRPMTAPTSWTGERISRSARNDSLWQVKKRGAVGVSSHAENCGYDERTVKSLQERGWHLYKDGEKVW